MPRNDGNPRGRTLVTTTLAALLVACGGGGGGSGSVPVPAPTITSFTATPASVPAGGGDVVLAWAASDADTLTIDHGVGAVTGTTKIVHVTATTTFTLTAHNSTADATRQLTVTAASYVDAAGGLDTNPCTQALPCKNIAHAMTGALPGATVVLLDGTFDSTDQAPSSFPVPDGVTVKALNPNAATVKNVQMTLAGSGAFEGIDLEGTAQIDASSSTGSPTLTLTGVRVHSTNDSGSGGAALGLGGTVVATMAPGSLAGGEYTLPAKPAGAVAILRGASRLTVQGGVFDSHGVRGGTHQLLAATERSELVLDGVTFRNMAELQASFGDAIVVVAGNDPASPARATLRNGTTIENFEVAGSTFNVAGITLGSNAVLVMDDAHVTGGGQAAIAASGGGTGVSNVSVTFRNGTSLDRNLRAVSLAFAGGPLEELRVDGASCTGNAAGMRVTGTSNTTVDLHLLSYTANSPGAASGTIDNQIAVGHLKVRASAFTNNGGTGLSLGTLAGAAPADLGTAADPGGNTFTGSGGTNLHALTGGTVNAAGNTWEPSTQGSDAAGHYAAQTLAGPQTGKNFTTNAGTTLKF